MLRAVILLILLNVSLLVWSATAPTPEKKDIRLVEPEIPQLVLLPDMPNDLYRGDSAKLASSCYSLGPFNSQNAASIVGKRIKDYGLAFTVRSIRSMETLRYLVYLPPQENEALANKIAKDLREQHIENVTVITEGVYKNAISVGFYSNINRAKRETEQIRYLGYDARHSEERTPLEVFWIDYDEPFGSNTPVIAWSRAIEPTAAVQRIPRTCKATA